MDSLDICQSVLGSFFVRAALGQFDLNSSEQLIKLLATIARNRVLEAARQQQAAKRDVRRLDGDATLDHQADRGQETPSQLVATRDLLQSVYQRLTSEERQIADARAEGRTWAEIGAPRRVAPDTLRIQWARTLDRVARDLGLEDSYD